MAHQNLSRRGQQNRPKQRMQFWFLRAFEACHPQMLDGLAACRPLVDELEGRDHPVLWERLVEHAEWARLAPEHLDRSTAYPDEAADKALRLHTQLESWAQQLVQPPGWFLKSIVFSLVLAKDSQQLRLHSAPHVYAPVHAAPMRKWFYPAPDGEERDDTYIQHQIERFRLRLAKEVTESKHDLSSDPNVLRLPNPSPNKPKQRFEWAARRVVGESVRSISERADSEWTNVRKLVKEVLDQIDWPLSQGTNL